LPEVFDRVKDQRQKRKRKKREVKSFSLKNVKEPRGKFLKLKIFVGLLRFRMNEFTQRDSDIGDKGDKLF